MNAAQWVVCVPSVMRPSCKAPRPILELVEEMRELVTAEGE